MTSSRAEQRREATEAFRRYAAHKQNPDHAEMLGTETWLSDRAVSSTLSLLRSEGKGYIADAVAAVYFVDPTERLDKGDINRRVVRYCATGHMAESTVYGWLAIARRAYWAIAFPDEDRGAG
jgi:hypothetical protein